MLCKWERSNSTFGWKNRLTYQGREILMVGPWVLCDSGHLHNDDFHSAGIQALILAMYNVSTSNTPPCSTLVNAVCSSCS